jgi:hypothetical protein
VYCGKVRAEDLPTDDQVAGYREHGWFVSGPIIPHDVLDRMRDLLEAHQHRPARDRLPDSVGVDEWSPAKGAGLRNNQFPCLQDPRFRELSLMPVIGAIAARLAGTPAIRLFYDQAITKPPADQEAVVGWHADRAYWSTCTSTELLTAWIPFEDSSVENGTLMVVDGSHRWPEADHLRDFKVRDLDDIGTRLGRDLPTDAVVPVAVRKGQVEFHHCRLLHASGPNRSPHPRVAFAVHLQDAANEHHDAFGPAGEPITIPSDRLCRRTADGRPDYSDPDVFPVLWAAGSEG